MKNFEMILKVTKRGIQAKVKPVNDGLRRYFKYFQCYEDMYEFALLLARELKKAHPRFEKLYIRYPDNRFDVITRYCIEP